VWALLAGRKRNWFIIFKFRVIKARIKILNASKANQSVIFRRGPSKWVQLLKWNTKTDEILPRQWFNGRIYSNKSDLSPYGEYMIYFAAKFKMIVDQYSWTALSKPPYYSALAIWKKEDTYDGGGYFESTRKIYISQTRKNLEFEAKTNLDGVEFNYKLKDFPFDNILYKRMLRDGWKWSKDNARNLENADVQIIKRISEDSQLVQLGFRLTNYKYTWKTIIKHKSKTIDLKEFDNVDANINGRIIMSKNGCIYTIEDIDKYISRQSPMLEVDLNMSEPYELIAPYEMMKW